MKDKNLEVYNDVQGTYIRKLKLQKRWYYSATHHHYVNV